MRYAVEKSFNCITIDGDTSTNDTVIVMSNGQSDVPTIKNSPRPSCSAAPCTR
jgi:glutamate N-acetyltransferase/amino-acid N-acetyltransferase